MKPVILSVRSASGFSKKTGKAFDCIVYDILYRDITGRFGLESVFIDRDKDPRLIPGDLVIRNSFTRELQKTGHNDVLLELLDALN